MSLEGAAGARTVNEIKNRRPLHHGDVVDAWRSGRRFLISSIYGSSPSCALNFRHFATLWAPRGSLTGGHVKVMLAYGHSLSLDHQGFRPFSPDHREAAGPVGPAVARVLRSILQASNSDFMRSRDRVHGGHGGDELT